MKTKTTKKSHSQKVNNIRAKGKRHTNTFNATRDKTRRVENRIARRQSTSSSHGMAYKRDKQQHKIRNNNDNITRQETFKLKRLNNNKFRTHMTKTTNTNPEP